MESSNSPQTGGLTSIAEPMRKIAASIPTAPPMFSPTTSTIGRGNQSGETLPAGSSDGKSGAVQTQPGRWEQRQFGRFGLPAAVTRSMTNSLASLIVIESDGRTPVDGQSFDFAKLPPFRLKAGMTRADAGTNLQAIDEACKPAAKHEIVPVVATLRARTKARAGGDGESRFVAETTVQDLSAYPIDVVRFACDYWIDGGKAATFFPSWPELKEICDKRMDGRLRLKRALIHALSEAQ